MTEKKPKYLMFLDTFLDSFTCTQVLICLTCNRPIDRETGNCKCARNVVICGDCGKLVEQCECRRTELARPVAEGLDSLIGEEFYVEVKDGKVKSMKKGGKK